MNNSANIITAACSLAVVIILIAASLYNSQVTDGLRQEPTAYYARRDELALKAHELENLASLLNSTLASEIALNQKLSEEYAGLGGDAITAGNPSANDIQSASPAIPPVRPVSVVQPPQRITQAS